MAGLPLEGVRVADFCWVWAGPASTLQLAHLGAEVVKVESTDPVRMDTVRRIPPFADDQPGPNRAGYFNIYNQGKKSITLNLGCPEGREVAKRLVAVSDVVTENFAGGVIDRLGLGYEALRRIKPDIVMISLSGYGATGPKCSYIAYGPAQVPMIGLASLTGYPGGGPREVGLSYGDPNAGLHAAFAVLSALVHREQTGEGQYIDMSQWEAGIGLVAEGLMSYVMGAGEPPRQGNRDQCEAPQGVFRCAGEDQWVSIACWSDEEWRALAEVIGGPALASDGRYATREDRKRNEEELEILISAWTASRAPFDATEILQAAGVAAFPALSNQGVVDDAQLAHRGFFTSFEHPEVGTRKLPGIPWKLSGTPCEVGGPAPCLGEHTDHVLRDILGYSDAEVEALAAAGAIR